ncbi:MAG: hypothetical protein H7329_06900 [Opitutaceae bacterium]|nr:hypothetical protein [Cytophagales bacterium]
MKPTFTNLEITRLAYNEAFPIDLSENQSFAEREFKLLKRMQKVVDNCLLEPSQQSVDKIMAALKSM